MSLSIDSRYITGIYALGQWFKVKKDSVDVDAFEFTNWEEAFPADADPFELHSTTFIMGSLYPDPERGEQCGSFGPHSKGHWANPGGHHGISFIDAASKERVSFSLKEVRAFRETRP